MRHWIGVIVISVLSIPSPTQSVQQKVSLELGGVTVWLGMPRQEVISKFASAGFKQLWSHDESILFVNGDNSYTTQFNNERLTFANREWYFPKSDLDAFQSTIAALGSIAGSDSSAQNCTISHEPLNKPDEHFDRILISCGSRSLLLIQGSMTIGKKAYGVSERIGQFR